MHQSTLKIVLSALLASLIPAVADAALIDRGGGLVYDEDLDITWLQNANLAAGSIYDQTSQGIRNEMGPAGPCCSPTDGLMTWEKAVAWADNLVFQGYDDWRLPTLELRTIEVNPGGYLIASPGCMAWSKADCITNEYSYMHRYHLGATPPAHGPDSNRTGDVVSVGGTNLFSVQDFYWTSVELGAGAYAFRFDSGGFGSDVILDWEMAAWAVRDGDSKPGGTEVPAPSSLVLMLVGIVAFGGYEIKRKYLF